jgi:hypothetical protein
MSRRLQRTVRVVAAGTTLTAAAIGLGAGGAGAAVRSPGVRAGAPSPPLLKATISKKGLALSGPRTFAPGRIAISLKSVGNEYTAELVSFRPGYTFAKFKADVGAFAASAGPNGPTKAGLKHLDNAIAHSTLYGGLDAVAGQTLTGTFVLPKAGTYWLYNDTELPAQPKKLTATGPAVTRATPASSATVTAKNGDRFGGAATLPATGTITFRNVSTNSPHFLDLQHVKAGTTRQQVLTFLLNGANGEPSFGLNGQANTDAISPGHAQTLTYSLPKGEYVEMCFFPDPVTGIPHALMGMIRVVHLK